MIISVIRTILLYIFIITSIRIMGKRQISELQTSELVITFLLSDIAAIPMQDNDQSMVSGIVPLLVLVICEIVISVLMLKHTRLRKLICGKPVIVINNGKVDQKAMEKLRMSAEDLFKELRQKDVFHIEDVDYAIVETNGKMSILKKASCDFVTAKQLGVNTNNEGIQTVIVSDGQIAESSLEFCHLDKNWLKGILKLENTKLQEIFIMTADKGKHYRIIKSE